MILINIIHLTYVLVGDIVLPVIDRSSGVSTMIVTYIVLAISGLIGSVIAVDEVKSATQHD